MRRNAVTLLASLFLVSMLTGCSLFGGKKKNATADTYDPATDYTSDYAADTTPAPAEPYQGYPSGGTYNTATSGSRSHTVQKKETLYSLARQYYSDQSRWKDIYEANRSEIGSDPNKLRVGQRLTIP